MNRRQLLELVATQVLLGNLAAADAWAQPVRPIARRWVRELWALAKDLRTAAIAPHVWQERVEALFGRVPREELLAAVDFEKALAPRPLRVGHPDVVPFALPGLEGISEDEVMTRSFGLREGDAIVPHGHHHMCSIHVVLAGQFHVRHYDRVLDEPGHLVLRPTRDHLSDPGARSSVSDERDNVHWLVVTKGPAYTLDVIIPKLSASEAWGRDYVDPDRAERRPDGTLRAPRISVKEALARYGTARAP